MVRRSQLMALAVAFVVAVALRPATAHAADGCLANPSGAARTGKHWYYQTNEETQQRCWFLAERKTAGKDVALPRFPATSQEHPAEQTIASACAASPGPHVRGKRWSYQTDTTTGQKCWRLSRIARSLKSAPARLPSPMLVASAGEPSAVLPQPVADAQASIQEDLPAKMEDAAAPVAGSAEVASTGSDDVGPAIREEPPPTFEQRWTADFKTASAADLLTDWSKNSGIHQTPVRLVAKTAFKDAELVMAARVPLIDVLVVAVATLGSVFILLGLFDWSALFSGAAATASKQRSPLQLPQLDAESDPISALRPDQEEMLPLFAPNTAAAKLEFAPRLMAATV